VITQAMPKMLGLGDSKPNREGGDETDSGAVDEPDMECGSKAAAGIDRGVVGRGPGMARQAEDRD
jgi:hypothetical protein